MGSENGEKVERKIQTINADIRKLDMKLDNEFDQLFEETKSQRTVPSNTKAATSGKEA